MVQQANNRVKIIADTLHPDGYARFTTFEFDMPKSYLAQLNTHRSLVKSSESSRAVPIYKFIKKVQQDLVIPHWTTAKKGMQGNKLDSSTIKYYLASLLWSGFSKLSMLGAYLLDKLGIHKQNANRLLEPFSRVKVLVSGTEWDNFFMLRCDEAAQPEFSNIANEARFLYKNSQPIQLNYGDWHIPYPNNMEGGINLTIEEKLLVYSARCARLSYATHENVYSLEKDLELGKRLVLDKHFSPLEHIAQVVRRSYLEGSSTNITIPSKLQKFLSWSQENKLVWTRQYSGFYTYRSQLEDTNE